jgi:hypothetical protein
MTAWNAAPRFAGSANPRARTRARSPPVRARLRRNATDFQAALDPLAPWGARFYARGKYVSELPDTAIDTFLDHAVGLTTIGVPLSRWSSSGSARQSRRCLTRRQRSCVARRPSCRVRVRQRASPSRCWLAASVVRVARAGDKRRTGRTPQILRMIPTKRGGREGRVFDGAPVDVRRAGGRRCSARRGGSSSLRDLLSCAREAA